MQTLPEELPDASLFRRTPWLGRLIHFDRRFSRAMTVGVRGMVLDGEGRVFLIKHSYVDGWHMPGGGVEAGETLLEALTRELAEEGNIELTAPPMLHSVYFHPVYSRRDHVALYVIRHFARARSRCRIARSSSTASFRSMRCPTARPPARAPALPKCSTGTPAAAVW